MHLAIVTSSRLLRACCVLAACLPLTHRVVAACDCLPSPAHRFLPARSQGVGSDGVTPTAIGCLCEMPCAADMRDVPTYAQRFTGGNGLITLNPKRVAKADTACTGVPTYKRGGAAEALQTVRA